MEIQERILDTAFSLFCQFGTRSITMDAIAQRMGVSKKTLYAHFADKDELHSGRHKDLVGHPAASQLSDARISHLRHPDTR